MYLSLVQLYKSPGPLGEDKTPVRPDNRDGIPRPPIFFSLFYYPAGHTASVCLVLPPERIDLPPQRVEIG